jgi:hypothetical protein
MRPRLRSESYTVSFPITKPKAMAISGSSTRAERTMAMPPIASFPSKCLNAWRRSFSRPHPDKVTRSQTKPRRDFPDGKRDRFFQASRGSLDVKALAGPPFRLSAYLGFDTTLPNARFVRQIEEYRHFHSYPADAGPSTGYCEGQRDSGCTKARFHVRREGSKMSQEE